MRPRADIVGRALRDLPAGTVLAMEEIESGDVLEALLVPSAAVGGDRPLPLYMAAGRRLTAAVAAGELLPASAVEPPAGSRLWALRREQDRRLLA